MKSIIQDKKECYITKRTDNLHEHHVFFGGSRSLSEKYGLKVYLTADWHNMSNKGVHFNKDLDIRIKQIAQQRAMEHYGWNTEDFISIFGRNYI